MKTNLKKMTAIIMTATTLAVGTTAVNVSAYATDIDANSVATIETISPRYAKYTTVSFNVTSTSNPKTGSVTVTDAPAKLSYWSCTTGAALVTIKVNNSVYGNYVIPETNGTTANITINCSKGDTVSYSVVPYAAGNYVKAIGSFTLYY